MTKIDDAVIEESDIFIYNLGTVFVIDRVLFASQERIGQVLAKNADRIPSFGWTGPDGAGEETTVKELENNNYHVFLILQDFKNMCMYYLNIKRDFAVILVLRENINVKDKIFLFGKKKSN